MPSRTGVRAIYSEDETVEVQDAPWFEKKEEEEKEKSGSRYLLKIVKGSQGVCLPHQRGSLQQGL